MNCPNCGVEDMIHVSAERHSTFRITTDKNNIIVKAEEGSSGGNIVYIVKCWHCDAAWETYDCLEEFAEEIGAKDIDCKIYK